MRGAACTLPAVLIGRASSAVLLCALSLFARQAVAGSDEPPPHYLSLTHLDAYLELRGDYTYRKVDTEDRLGGRRRRQRNREWSVEERLGLTFGGTVIDAGFITFGGEISFALTQDRFRERTDSSSQTDRDNGYLLQYDLRANFFQGRKLSGSVYGLRQEDRINRRFQSTLDQDRTGFGTSWALTEGSVRMELSYDYRKTDRTGNADPSDNEHFTESTLRYGIDWNISERQRLEFSYEHANIKQEYQGLAQPFETTRDLLTLEHTLEFGPDDRNDLRTLLHWQEESGDFARDFFEIGPQLTIKHSDTFQTIYKYQFNRERFEGLDVESQRIDFQLVHQLYTNLTTTVGAFALYEDVEDDVNTTQYGASVDWQYNRRNRSGRLFANLSLAYDTEEVDGDNGRRLVLNESHRLRDPIAATLRNRNVVRSSIVVTDAANRRIFQPGADYFIIERGNAVQLTRIDTGRIADGDTILVDYQIRTPARGQLDTIRVDFSLEQRFTNGFTPYYRLSYRNQEDDVSVGFLRRADRTNHHRVGFNYETKRYNIGAEYEIFDDTVDPYDAFHINGLVHLLSEPDHTVDASTRLSRLFFEGGLDDRNITLIDLELDHRWRLSETLSTIERIAYRFENDSSAGDTHGWDVRAGFEYAVGDLTGELTFEYDRLDLPHSQEENFGVFFRLRREFSDVFTRR